MKEAIDQFVREHHLLVWFGVVMFVSYFVIKNSRDEARRDDDITAGLEERECDYGLRIVATRLARANFLARERNLILAWILVVLIVLAVHFIGF